MIRPIDPTSKFDYSDSNAASNQSLINQAAQQLKKGDLRGLSSTLDGLIAQNQQEPVYSAIETVMGYVEYKPRNYVSDIKKGLDHIANLLQLTPPFLGAGGEG